MFKSMPFTRSNCDLFRIRGAGCKQQHGWFYRKQLRHPRQHLGSQQGIKDEQHSQLLIRSSFYKKKREIKKKCSYITYSVVNVTFYLHNMQKGLSANCSNLYGMRTKDTDFSKMFLLRNNQEVRTSNLAVKAEVWGIFFSFFHFAHVYIFTCTDVYRQIYRYQICRL